MFRSIGTNELIVIAAVVVFLFGGRKIPELFEGVAKALKEFKDASKETDKKDKGNA
jgi:sec-independent protein translocase protein TatA